MMLYQSNWLKESPIEIFDFMVICDVCLRPISHIHSNNEEIIKKYGNEYENLCLRCRKKGFHWKPWHGSSIP